MDEDNRDSAEYDLLLADQKEEKSEAVINRERFEASLLSQGPWGYSEKGLEAQKAIRKMNAVKTGLYTKIPLICKGDTCPYSETCPLLPYDLAPMGERCPEETTRLELLAVNYAEEIDYDNASWSDKQLLNDLLGYDIMLERCRALMAKEGTPVVEILAGIAENGEEIKQPIVSKAWEAYEKIVKKRNETYQLMMMTRKDNKKAGEGDGENLQTILADVLNSEDFADVVPET